MTPPAYHRPIIPVFAVRESQAALAADMQAALGNGTHTRDRRAERKSEAESDLCSLARAERPQQSSHHVD